MKNVDSFGYFPGLQEGDRQRSRPVIGGFLLQQIRNNVSAMCHSAQRIAGAMLLIIFATLGTNAQTTVTLGVGTGTSTTNSLFSTSSTGNQYSRSASIYAASEIVAAGGMPGTITKIRWHKNAGEYSASNINLTVYMKHVPNTAHPAANDWTSEVAGATQVFTTTTQSFPAGDSWIEITLNTPFLWNGSDNIEVLTDFYRPSAVNSAIGWYRSTVTDANLARVGSSAANVESLLLNSNRPDIQFDITPAAACTGIPTPGTAASSVPFVCSFTDFTLALSGQTLAAGIDVQWQSSADNITYTDIAGVTGTSVIIQQSATTWYRAKVTCNNGSPAFSTEVQVTTPALVSGTFTIDADNPTAGTNFNSFADAIAYIACGIGGPVTFNVVPTSGPYTGPIIIPEILGASAANRVTFNGNGEIITRNATASAERTTLTLDGADYITIDGFTIQTTGTTYGWGVHLLGDADFNEIVNNTITMNAFGTDSDNMVGVIASGSATSATSGGSADNNLISVNIISGGGSGIIMTGNGATLATNNQIIGNTILDYESYGIDLDDQGNIWVYGNDISRPTRTNTGVHYGINLSGSDSQNNLIEANRIHNTHTAISTTNSASYGIYITGADAPVTAPNMVVNNLVHTMDLAAGSAIIYGLANSSSNNAYYYHNTVALDYTASSNNDFVRGLYQTGTASGVEFKNNLVSVTMGGTGDKYGIYLNTDLSAVTTSNNVFYVNGAAGTNHIGHLDGTDHTTLGAWQAIGYDAGSVVADPQFLGAATGNYEPGNSVADNIGLPVGVLTDITTANRSILSPDAGAYEFDIPVACPAPIGITATDITCINALINWAALDTLGDFTLHYGPVGFDPTDPTTGGTSLYSLASGPFLLDFLTTNTSYDLYIEQDCGVAGVSTMSGPLMFTTGNCTPGVISGQDSYCLSGTPNLQLGNTDPNFTIQWQDSVVGGTWTTITGADTTFYTPASALTQTTWYRAITNGGTGNMTSNVFEVTVATPSVVSTNSPVNICAPGVVNLTATTTSGDATWYSDATSATPLHNGNSYSPTVAANTTFYVSAGSFSSENAGIVNGVGTNFITATAGWGLAFDALQPLTINYVHVYPTGTGTITIHILDYTTNTILYSGTPQPVSGTGTQKIQVPVNITVPVGNYKMGMSYTGITNLKRDSGVGGTFPYNSPSGALSIVAGANGGTSTTTSSYYWFYDWNISIGCASPRVPVEVNIVAPPVATATGNSPVTAGSDLNLSASGGTSYSWTGPDNFSSTDQNPVIANAQLAAGGTYTVIADNGACTDTATVTIVVTQNTAPLSGNYTINQNALASSTNFISFTTAADYLNTNGVAGPVTITVVTGTSPYTNQQFLLGEIPGASATNTVTIEGNGETLYFCSNSAGNRDIVRLDGTDWLRLYNLNIEGTCGYGWGIHLLNGAENNIISGNTITVNTTSPAIGNHQGIIAVNSFTSPMVFAGNTVSNLEISGNTVNGGYHGIRINGNAATPGAGLLVEGNTINDAYEYGLYVLYNNDPVINDNVVDMRAGNVRSIGLVINRIEDGLELQRNRVMNAGRQGAYLNHVNYFQTSAANTGIIANNMIGGGMQNSTHADGLYLNFVKYMNIYHNSTLTDNSGTGYSFAVTNWKSQYLDVRNNSFAYTGGGTGYAVAIGASIQNYDADYNNYYSNGSNFARMGNADRGDLNDLENAPNPTLHDMNSTDLNPMYVWSATDQSLHLQPASPLGMNLVPAVAAVTVDIDNQNRQALVTMGADELNVAPRAATQDLDVDVYPNPFRDALQVAVKGAEGKVALELVDMMGRLVYSRTVDATAVITLKPEVQMAQGVYLLKVTNNGSTSQFRVVKQ